MNVYMYQVAIIIVGGFTIAATILGTVALAKFARVKLDKKR